jgi:hypothetical protein
MIMICAINEKPILAFRIKDDKSLIFNRARPKSLGWYYTCSQKSVRKCLL